MEANRLPLQTHCLGLCRLLQKSFSMHCDFRLSGALLAWWSIFFCHKHILFYCVGCSLYAPCSLQPDNQHDNQPLQSSMASFLCACRHQVDCFGSCVCHRPSSLEIVWAVILVCFSSSQGNSLQKPQLYRSQSDKTNCLKLSSFRPYKVPGA